jgi:putative heme iron utilization protein
MNEPPQPSRFQPTTPEALVKARALLADTGHAALASLELPDGQPLATRVIYALLPDGAPFILVSGLSPHSAALRADPRCSLLVGTVGKGDPLAHARVTLRCRAEELPRSPELRATFLAAHPKAELYIDLPDFAYFRLVPETVGYIAAFGRAYRFSGAELFAR